MSRSAVSLIRELASRMGELSVIRSSAIGTATQVVSDELDQYIPQTTQNMAGWVYCTEGVNAGYERRARAYAPSADTLTLHTAFPNATESDVEYELHARTQRARKLEALNGAIGQLGLYWPRDVIDTSLLGIAQQHEYPLPSGTNWASVTAVELQHLPDEDPYGQTGAAQFTAASSQYLSQAHTADFATGDIDWWGHVDVYFDSMTDEMALMTKWTQTGNIRQWRTHCLASGLLRLQLSADGATNTGTVAATDVTCTTDQWYCVFFGYDSVNNVTFIQVDDGVRHTTALVGGCFAATPDLRLGAYQTTVAASFLNGRIDNACFGKNPVGGLAQYLNTMAARFHNNGEFITYSDLTSTEKTNWGLVSFWECAELSGTRSDSHASNDFGDNAGVSSAPGVPRVVDPSAPLYPYDDARDLNWDIRRETNGNGDERWVLVFRDAPTPGNILRVTGTAFFSALALDTDVLPTGGLWEGAALDWIYDWGKYRLLDETVERQPGGQAERYRQRAVDKLQQAKQDVLLLMKPKSGNRIVTPWSRSAGSLRGGINLAEFNIFGLARDFS